MKNRIFTDMKRVDFAMKFFAILMMFAPLCAHAQQADSLSSDQPVDKITTMSDDQLWSMANTDYINSRFDQAIDGYERLVGRGIVSSELYYNLANAYYETSQIGESILNYHRSLRIRPGDMDARHNLKVAMSHTKDAIESIPEFFVVRWLKGLRNFMGCTSWSIISLVSLALAIALMIVFLLSTKLSWRKMGFYGTALSALVCVISLSFAMKERQALTDQSQAIVMSVSASVKNSPDSSATELFVLHEGTRVEITNALDGWCEVMIADGNKGWIQCDKMEVI